VLTEHEIPAVVTEPQILQYSQISGHYKYGGKYKQQTQDCSFHGDYLAFLIDRNILSFKFFRFSSLGLCPGSWHSYTNDTHRPANVADNPSHSGSRGNCGFSNGLDRLVSG